MPALAHELNRLLDRLDQQLGLIDVDVVSAFGEVGFFRRLDETRIENRFRALASGTTEGTTP